MSPRTRLAFEGDRRRRVARGERSTPFQHSLLDRRQAITASRPVVIGLAVVSGRHRQTRWRCALRCIVAVKQEHRRVDTASKTVRTKRKHFVARASCTRVLFRIKTRARCPCYKFNYERQSLTRNSCVIARAVVQWLHQPTIGADRPTGYDSTSNGHFRRYIDLASLAMTSSMKYFLDPQGPTERGLDSVGTDRIWSGDTMVDSCILMASSGLRLIRLEDMGGPPMPPSFKTIEAHCSADALTNQAPCVSGTL